MVEWMTSSRRAALLFLMVVALPVSAWAQTRTMTFDVTPLTKRLSIKQQHPLTVRVDHLGPMGVVAVEAASEPQVEVKAMAIIYKEPSEESEFIVDSLKKIQKMVPLSERSIQINNDAVTIDCGAKANRRVVVYLRVPTGTRLSLYINGRLIRRGPFFRNITVQHGEAMSTGDGHLFQRAIMRATGFPMGHPDTIQYIPDLDMYSVPWMALQDLALETVVPVPSVSWSKKRVALVRLFVNRNGLVTDVEYASGDHELAEATMDALRSWRFRPFMVNDQPASVTSVVGVVFEDGQIRFSGSR